MSSAISDALISIDTFCDYVPVASTITNLVDIFEKCVFFRFYDYKSIDSNRYFYHVSDKSSLRCIILLVPILGNIIVGIYDLIENHRLGMENLRLELAKDKDADDILFFEIKEIISQLEEIISQLE